MGISFSGTRPAPWIAEALHQYEIEDSAYIAHEIAPAISVKNKTGNLPVIPRENLANDGNSTARAAGANYDRSDISAEQVAYDVVAYGHEVPLPDEDVEEFSSAFNAQLVAGTRIRNKILGDREIRMKNLIFSSTWISGGATLYKDWSAAPWDTAGSDAINHIQTSIEAIVSNTGMHPNAMIIPWLQWNNLTKLNTGVKALVSGLQVAYPEALKAVLMEYFGLKKIIVGSATYNSAIQGQSASMTQVWGDDYVMLAKVAMTADPSEACVARSVAWAPYGMDMRTATYEEPQTDSTIVKGAMHLDEIVVDSSFGFLIKVDA